MSFQPAHPPRKAVPPLQPGDRLTRAEFERRFDATPNLRQAELIEGIVYMPPPVSHEYHAQPHADLLAVLGAYRAATPNVMGGDNASLRLDGDNMPQPDAYLMIASHCVGQARIGHEGYVEGAPELIAEIAASNAACDLHAKLSVYQRSGVREYIVWRTYEAEIDYFIHTEGRYDRLSPDADGIWRSHVFGGLWLAPHALLTGDLAAALQCVQRGVASPEHARFVAELAERAGPSSPAC